jgi:hypothetical protein
MGKLFEPVPHSSWIAGAGALAMVVALWSLTRAIRLARRGRASSADKRTARALLVTTIGALMVVPILTVWLTAAQRALFRGALERASLGGGARTGELVQALSGSLTTLPFGMLMVWPVAFFPGVAALVLLTKVLGLPDESEPAKPVRWWAYALASMAWTYAGLLIPAAGIAEYSSAIMSALGDALYVEPEEKAPLMLAAISIAETDFIERLAKVGIIMAIPLIGGILISLTAGAEEPHEGAQRGQPEWWIGGLCWLAAAAVFVAAAPLRAELAEPVPSNPYLGGRSLLTPIVVLPELQGTDVINYGPIVQLDAARLWLDGRATTEQQLAGDLDILRRAYAAQFPERVFPGGVAVMCDARTPLERLDVVLGLARAAAYLRFQLIVGRERIIERPLLGKLKRDNLRGNQLLVRRGRHRCRRGHHAHCAQGVGRAAANVRGASSRTDRGARHVRARRDRALARSRRAPPTLQRFSSAA